MNPHLEEALMKYYRRRERTFFMMMLAACAAGILAVPAVHVIQPEGGFNGTGFVGFELAMACTILIFFLCQRFQHAELLEIFRNRPGDVRGVQRGVTSFRVNGIKNDYQTLFVYLADGRRLPLYSNGNDSEFVRLQIMLEMEIDKVRR